MNRRTGLGGQPGGQLPDRLDSHVGVEHQALCLAGPLDQPIEGRAMRTGLAHREQSIGRLRHHQLRGPQPELLSTVGLVSLGERSDGGEQVPVAGSHTRAMLVLLDAGNVDQERNRRDVVQIERGPPSHASIPAMGRER